MDDHQFDFVDQMDSDNTISHLHLLKMKPFQKKYLTSEQEEQMLISYLKKTRYEKFEIKEQPIIDKINNIIEKTSIQMSEQNGQIKEMCQSIMSKGTEIAYTSCSYGKQTFMIGANKFNEINSQLYSIGASLNDYFRMYFQKNNIIQDEEQKEQLDCNWVFIIDEDEHRQIFTKLENENYNVELIKVAKPLQIVTNLNDDDEISKEFQNLVDYSGEQLQNFINLKNFNELDNAHQLNLAPEYNEEQYQQYIQDIYLEQYQKEYNNIKESQNFYNDFKQSSNQNYNNNQNLQGHYYNNILYNDNINQQNDNFQTLYNTDKSQNDNNDPYQAYNVSLYDQEQDVHFASNQNQNHQNKDIFDVDEQKTIVNLN